MKIFEAFGLLYPPMDEAATAAAMPKSANSKSPPNVVKGKKGKGPSTSPRTVATPDAKNRKTSPAPQKLGMPPPNVRGSRSIKEEFSPEDILRLAIEGVEATEPMTSRTRR
jgi:hypothetical protein